MRKKEEWSTPAKLQSALSQFAKPNIPFEDLSALKNELRNYWKRFNPQQRIPVHSANSHLSGRIEKILHNDEKGADGFIKYDGNKSIYFRVNKTEEIINKLNIGLEVMFKILPATEDKKAKAIQIKVK